MIDRSKYIAWLTDVVAQARALPQAFSPPRGQPDVLGQVLRSKLLQHTGTWAEFGVADGTSLRRIAARRGDAHVWGFDTFIGLPEEWKRADDCVHLAGHFAQDKLPRIDGASLVMGLFQDTLPSWRPPLPLTFVHVDCDLYSSTKCVLDHVVPKLAPGAIVAFDEIFQYPGFEEHEALALYEATEAGFQWEPLFAGGERFAIVYRPTLDALDPPEVDPATGRDPGAPEEDVAP